MYLGKVVQLLFLHPKRDESLPLWLEPAAKEADPDAAVNVASVSETSEASTTEGEDKP